MCGICGFYTRKHQTEQVLQAMNNTIRHRGPDAEGFYYDCRNNGYQLGMAHSRLAIIDISEMGNQPMVSEDERFIVAFNGEIYNFLSLREELEKKGYRHRSQSDTEVLLNAYREWGIESLHRLNGMFAISIYERESGTLYLIRDRTGVKPLYYTILPEGIVWGSELKPIMQYPGIQLDIDRHALSSYLYQQYITGTHSIYSGIYKLQPGDYLSFRDGKKEINSYWDLRKQWESSKLLNLREEAIEEELDAIMTQSVRERMISDVPLGAFLSGGIDSSLIVSLMQKVSISPVKTFSIGFYEDEYNEAHHAKKIADYLGTDHTELYLSIDEAKNNLKRLPLFYDEPFADSSQMPTMLVAQMARESVTVALSGDGADEFFCGYNKYENSVWRPRRNFLVANMLRVLPFHKSLLKKLGGKWERFLQHNINVILNDNYMQFLQTWGEDLIKDYTMSTDNRYFDILSAASGIQEKLMLQDMVTYLPDDIMTKVDRASMAVSLETRAPFVDDVNVIQYSFQIPHRYKYYKGTSKYILKRLLKRYLPESLFIRPKQGFGLPFDNWLRNEWNPLLLEFSDRDFIKQQNIFDHKTLEKLLKEYKEKKQGAERIICSFFFFQLWYNHYMRN